MHYDFLKMGKKLSKYLDDERYMHTMGVLLFYNNGLNLRERKKMDKTGRCPRLVP